MKLFSNRRIISDLMKENQKLKADIVRLENLCEQKDIFFKEMISDGLRHGSHLAAKHMSDRNKYLKGK